MNHKCKKHDIDLLCMAGCSAHPDNWYCPQCDQEEQYKAARQMRSGDRLVLRRFSAEGLESDEDLAAAEERRQRT